ncbi:hypothetical protein LP419_13870 [Massilia sp. H-1]|nr:hypothetical protein LP419_13870 [Massilia sp. H-1]
MLIEVSDDGVGLRQTSGKGLGLATVKARLRGRFGQAAVLEVGPGPDAERAGQNPDRDRRPAWLNGSRTDGAACAPSGVTRSALPPSVP